MFDRMNLRSIHDRFIIRCGHTKIERGDDFLSDMIFAGNIYPRL